MMAYPIHKSIKEARYNVAAARTIGTFERSIGIVGTLSRWHFNWFQKHV